MNKNKGVINLELVVVIVLIVAIVGGGAYYLGKGSNKLEVKNPENVLPNNENQNLPVVEDGKVDTTKVISLDMSSELARTYTTAFTTALKKPANFDGHYSIASWGCGAGVMCYGIVDKLNGKAYSAPGDDYNNSSGYFGDADFDSSRWSVDSNIFKVIGYTSIDSYKFENEKFTKIGSTSFPKN